MAKYKKSTDGYYHAKVWTGELHDGKRVYKQLTSNKSSRDLEKLVEEYNLSRKTGRIVSNSRYFGEYAEEWLDTYKSHKELNTRRMYENVIQKHLCVFDYILLTDISSSMIQKLINETAKKPRTCQQIVLTLKQILKAAERDKLVPIGTASSLFFNLDIPRYEAKEKRPLTDREKEAVLNVKLPPMHKTYLMLLYYTGMRREELLALEASKIDFKTLLIKVDTSIVFDGSTALTKPPKSKNSYRYIPIANDLLPYLEEYVTEGLLFHKTTGGYMSQTSYTKFWKHIQKALTEYMGEEFTLTAHSFRHNFCTRLCYSSMLHHNITVKKIAELLGDSEKMVTDVYSHILEEHENAPDAINIAL